MSYVIEITLTPGIFSKSTTPTKETTVFSRTLSHLINNSKPGKVVSPGRIIPAYVEIEDDYKVLGAFTINTGGGFSFFPDIVGFNQSDHLTFGKDLIASGGHFTAIENKKHRKIISFDSVPLEGDSKHLFTVCFENKSVLMDLPKVIKMPLIAFNEEDESKYKEVLQQSYKGNSMMLSFPEGEGVYCIQAFAVPLNEGEGINIFHPPLGQMFNALQDLNQEIQAKKIFIETHENSDYKISLVCFKLIGKLKWTAGFIVGQANKL